jgi:hypothetical protein
MMGQTAMRTLIRTSISLLLALGAWSQSGFFGSHYTVVLPPIVTLMGSTSVQTNGTNSAAINTTSSGTGGVAASLITVWSTCYTANQAPTAPIDTAGNTYTPATYYHNGNAGQNGQFFYVLSPTNNAAMTWHISATGCTNGWMAVNVYSGVGVLDPGGDKGAYLASGNTVTTPSFTPSQSGDLVVSGVATYDGSFSSSQPSVSSPLTRNEWTAYAGTSDGVVAQGAYSSTSPLQVSWTRLGGFSGPAAAGVLFFKVP